MVSKWKKIERVWARPKTVEEPIFPEVIEKQVVSEVYFSFYTYFPCLEVALPSKRISGQFF